ncbi:AAA family ATPase [Limnoraphis robusta]|uniref:AAA family ATPase n=1 Tax=Limnoraphis robusta CCNP1315 TaxID=3110306 RepID=A0ABU5TTY9_9CYAN|nr:AAA family ATPase [Limnoraphis robusta]MEA5518372.1 AAA family ATPase [Limnoraphis robusta CCNP1315]MEA5547753.1 AAA family ATPase [Limnoraphis robusta CCNP1324]
MRIKEISVKNLFGMFDHVIPMNMDDRITIIHGPNGVGKTILLKMLNSLFNSEFSFLNTIPFTEFRVDFYDQSYLITSKPIEDKDNKQKLLKFSYYQQGKEVKNYTDNNSRLRDWSEKDNTVEILSMLAALSVISAKENKAREDYWLLELTENIEIGLIEAERLYNYSNESSRSSSKSMVSSVETYSQELAEKIQETLTEYGELSQSLDRTFPVRVVNQEFPSNLTKDALKDKLSQLEEQRKQLRDLGLLEQDENPDFQFEREIDDKTKSILSVYVEDVQKKLKVFSEISSKISLFKKIVESRFSHKKMSITKDKGFTFTTLNGNPLSPTNLSSGEQHELVMLYELLFKVKPNSLILIDEPEISLHVAWQVEFLNDLQDILKLANFDVLIATHSPDIINERWDLTVELKGPNK